MYRIEIQKRDISVRLSIRRSPFNRETRQTRRITFRLTMLSKVFNDDTYILVNVASCQTSL